MTELNQAVPAYPIADIYYGENIDFAPQRETVVVQLVAGDDEPEYGEMDSGEVAEQVADIDDTAQYVAIINPNGKHQVYEMAADFVRRGYGVIVVSAI